MYPYVLVCFSNVTRILPVCTRMYSYVPVCHPYVTRVVYQSRSQKVRLISFLSVSGCAGVPVQVACIKLCVNLGPFQTSGAPNG